MDERIFDISKPHKVDPGATSKPVIVGHHPEIPDPMIRENAPDKPQIPQQPEFGPPSDGNPLGLPAAPPTEIINPSAEPPAKLPPIITEPVAESKPELPPELGQGSEMPPVPEPAAEKPPAHTNNQLPPTAPMFNKATGQTVEPTHSSWKPEKELPISGRHSGNSGRKKLSLIIAATVLGFMGLYALLDSGLLVEVDLPLRIFSQDKEPVQTQQLLVPRSSEVTYDNSFALPTGWVWYENNNPNFRFAYPEEYGDIKQAQEYYGTPVGELEEYEAIFLSERPKDEYAPGTSGTLEVINYKSIDTAIDSRRYGPTIKLVNDKWIVAEESESDISKNVKGTEYKDLFSDNRPLPTKQNGSLLIHKLETGDEGCTKIRLLFMTAGSLSEVVLPSFCDGTYSGTENDKAKYTAFVNKILESVQQPV